MLGLMSGTYGYETKPNQEHDDGYADIVLRPIKLSKPSIIIEIKQTKEMSLLEKTTLEGLKQIKEKKYKETLKNDGYKNIIALSIGFCRKSCEVKFLDE